MILAIPEDDPAQSDHHNGSMAHQSDMIARTFQSSLAPRSVPMEIDLNEFMLDTDFDVFSRQFEISHQY
jgi:hypothetical protein